MPDMLYNREFYKAIAEKHPSQLEGIIAGKKGFSETLGKLITLVKEEGRVLGDPTLEELRAYLTMLGEFSVFEDKDITSTGSQAAEDYESWTLGSDNSEKSKKKTETIGYSSLLSLLGGMALTLVLANPLGLALMAVGYCGALGAGVIDSEPRRKRNEALSLIQETVGPFCEQLDLQVMTFFAANYFTNARDHFEQTYPLLEQGQREAVDAQLCSYLGAGGISGMDQNQLNDYLSGLLVPKVEDDV